MIDYIRSCLLVMEVGSVNQAASRLGIAQPTLSRQIQALEQEYGGLLFERGNSGMRPTDLGHAFREAMLPVLRAYDQARAAVTTHAKGQQTQLRVGYLGLSAARFLTPAVGRLRSEFPEIKLWLLDLSPGEQIHALREGTLDVALIGQEGASLQSEFYARRIARLRVCVALPSEHALAGQDEIPLTALKGERFIGASDAEVPGRNSWTARLCERAGFRAQFLVDSTTIGEAFALTAAERAPLIFPDYFDGNPPPGIAIARLSDRWARWDFIALRQRGRGSPAGRRLIEILQQLGDG